MKTQKFPWVPFALAELLLFAVVALTVHSTEIHFVTTPREIDGRLMELYSSLYYIEAESLAKQQLPVAFSRWSHYELDPGTFCGAGKNGVWYARGTYDVLEDNGTTERGPWEIFFLPETQTSLFVRVGDDHLGDFKAACLEAGVALPKSGAR